MLLFLGCTLKTYEVLFLDGLEALLLLLHELFGLVAGGVKRVDLLFLVGLLKLLDSGVLQDFRQGNPQRGVLFEHSAQQVEC